VPRRVDDDEDMPRRRRRGAAAIEVEAEAERGFVMRLLLRSPKDVVAGALAFAAVGAIVANALFLQAGPHPSPMFGSVATMPAIAPPVSPLPRPRPVEATTRSEASPLEAKPAEPRAVEPRTVAEPKASDSKALDPKALDPKTADPLTNLVKATSATPAAAPTVMRPPASIPASHSDSSLSPGGSRRIAAVQRALTEYGYGQLKPTGTIGADTQAAILKFERDRKVPATGQVTDRLVRELSTMIGHPIE
jgi:Putative peptidoglycan binding domain